MPAKPKPKRLFKIADKKLPQPDITKFSEDGRRRLLKITDMNILLATQVLITVRETAAILRCHRSMVYEYIQDNYLTAHCPNGPGTRPMHVRTESVRQFINNYSIGGTFGVVKYQEEKK